MNVVVLADAADLLIDGGVGVIPTDTVYGVVARVSDHSAVARLYELKARERKPGPIIAASVSQLVEMGIQKRSLTAVERYWPGPVSVVVPSALNLSYVDQGVGTLAVRIPNDRALLALLEQTGPLLTSSANQPGQPTAVNIIEAYQAFADTVDFYVDGGDYANKPPSTVIRVVDDVVEVLRAGAVQINEYGEIIHAV